MCDILCEPTGEGWSDELKLQSIDEDVDEDDLDEDGKERWLRQISMKLPYAVLRKSALKFTKGSKRENSISYYFLLFWFNQNSISVLKTLLSCLSEKTL